MSSALVAKGVSSALVAKGVSSALVARGISSALVASADVSTVKVARDSLTALTLGALVVSCPVRLSTTCGSASIKTLLVRTSPVSVMLVPSFNSNTEAGIGVIHSLFLF